MQAGVNVKALNKLRQPPVDMAADSTVLQMLLQVRKGSCTGGPTAPALLVHKAARARRAR